MPRKAASPEATDKPEATVKSSASFETSLSELEQIVTRLESGELPLEDALNEFERGIQLARQGQQTLLQAEQRVQILLSDDADAPLTPFTPDTE
ncbi:exodeoxyribonuclease VII small subunit [Yersinia sp. J1]|uniref:exodeoxyribonuclease VII small subunit n=1 Tax=Yersinia sp. J1 TaxID=3424774 RepID=UPI003D35DC59